jgi:hypothetical protein
MPLTRTVALVTGFLFPYASAALIPDGALQALEASGRRAWALMGQPKKPAW